MLCYVTLLWCCPSIHLYTHFPHDILNSFTAVNSKLGICLLCRRFRKPIDFGIVTLIFKVTKFTKVKFGFWTLTPLKTAICLGSGHMGIDLRLAALHFGVTLCKKVKNHFQHNTSKTIRAINMKIAGHKQDKFTMSIWNFPY